MSQDPKLQALANHINARLAQPSLPPLPSSVSSGSSVPSVPVQSSVTHGLTGPAPTLGNTSLSSFVPSLSPSPQASLVNPGNSINPTHPVNPMNQSNGMEGYFQNESDAILKQQRENGLIGAQLNAVQQNQVSKKKILLTGVYVGGAVFLISFILLVAVRPRFVMKKVKKENGTEEVKCNFLAIFLISLALLVIVLATAGISAAKSST